MSEHSIVMISPVVADACSRCGPETPHNIDARCACGQIACGLDPHIWTLQRNRDRGTLSPSFNWLNVPGEPSQGSHLHEFVTDIPIVKIGVLHGVG